MAFQHINYEEKMKRGAGELKRTNPKDVMKYGWKQRDECLWWIFWWEIIVVWWSTWSGKSTFCNQIADNVSRWWHRVVKYSLENRLENAAKEELFYMCNRLRRQVKKPPYKRWPFIANEYWKDWKLYDEFFEKTLIDAYKKLIVSEVIELDKDTNVTIDDLVKLMEEEVWRGTRLFIIDHLHYFIFDDNERLDLQIKNVMHTLNEMARKHNIGIILVAHYRNNTWWEKGRYMKPSLNYFRDSSSISQVAHKIIQIARDEDDNGADVTKFYFTKFRWPIQNLYFDGYFNLDFYEYRFTDAKIWDDDEPTVNNTDDMFKDMETESDFSLDDI